MTRSEAYETRDKRADNRGLACEPLEGLWPAEQRREIPPPPAAVWRTHGPVGRSMTFFADLPVPRPAGAALPPSNATPAWSAHVDSFFGPRQSGTWVRGTGERSDSSSWRTPSRPAYIPIPPAPKVQSPPLRPGDLLISPPKRAQLMLHLEEERDAGLLPERQLFGIPLRRSIRACGAVLLGAALIGMASDWSANDRAMETASDRATSTDLNAVLQPSAQWESHIARPVTTPVEGTGRALTQPAKVAKRTLAARLARGSSRHRAELDVEPTLPEGTSSLEAEATDVGSTDGPAGSLEAATANPGRTVTRAVLISSPRPRYPDLARQRGIDGSVVVRFKIDARGTVRDAAIEHANPPGVFDRAALHAIENSRYRPRIEDGKAVATPKVKKRFTFHVRSASK